ncbi:phosphoribosylformylglycinamidine synthase subunit PurS [Alphaproteobacteria bacterium]|jgi:phosphoribosylformylglycinamidine synthase|nr:phosphoribosylformylglycinamidine synthase subunit PurS [Alphaproteobacteria bacterium]MDC3146270.1 phosphoribosylformylglycinamidine synthase subunit PurS [Alphaproteobacteria bacterium]MDC3150032.1 phosphoribosylformylglycinamidine synthase subunit PurS [Alphaproteobacteria bacterium]|tara:strand:+ start:489 stop:728 length:240 start_codon:yes stop_codon:yes gene_type:complete
MRIKILIRLKSQILEPQGKVIEQSLNNLGFNEFNNIRQGKLIELDLPDNLSKEEKDQKIDSACKKLLVNDIIEEYEVLG